MFTIYDIRGIYKKEINENLMSFLAEKFYKYLKSKKNPTIIYAGIDLRKSSIQLLNAFINKFLTMKNAKVKYVGIIPSPLIHFLCIKNKKPGILITASHLSKNHNGIKFITPEGESWVYRDIDRLKKEKQKKIPYLINYKPLFLNEIYEDYLKYLKRFLAISRKINFSFFTKESPNNFLFKILPQFFPNLKLNPQSTIKIKSDFDGDRLMIYMKNKILSPEIILYSILKVSNYKKVGIPMTIHKNILSLFPSIKFFYIKTGHYYFKKARKKYNLDFAMEPSYHFYFFKELQTEGPVLAFLKFLKFLEKFPNFDFEDLKQNFTSKRIDIRKKLNLKKIKEYFQKSGFKIKVFDDYYFYKKFNKKDWLGINIRKSQTEDNLYRVFLETSNKNLFKIFHPRLKNLLK